MAENPVTVYQGGTLAQQVLSSAPEGMLIAPVWRRIAAFAIDVVVMSLLLQVLTRFQFLEILISWNYLTEDLRYAASFLMTWLIFFASLWLYWKYTGRAYGRSLGQRAFRIAIVHDNGTLLELHHFGPRAFHKLRYLIPVLGWLFGIRDIFRARSKTAEYRTSVDLSNHTVAAVDWSLPSDTRLNLK
jgi:hypothetical protein